MNTREHANRIEYVPRHLTVELTNTCNLHCSYCLRDDDALYHMPAHFLSAELLKRIIGRARDEMGIEQIMFAGGEPSLHPKFNAIIEAVASQGLKCSLVTNGWHFERVWPVLLQYRDVVTHVAFSIDGPTRESHDKWRGRGSFDRVVRAFSRCWAADFPFTVKAGIRRDTVDQLQAIALFAARLGAANLNFAHLMPTSNGIAEFSAWTIAERDKAEREIASLNRIFKMPITIDVGYRNVDPSAPCLVLAGASANIDYLGRLSLCCNLSGFRGGAGGEDIVADLNQEDFTPAYARLRKLAGNQLQKRKEVLASLAAAGVEPDLTTGSPCLFCLQTFGKMPWNREQIVLIERARSVANVSR
jgi:MoaA/NifB/PqqE/SkfB family radical SAM enzyme